MPADPPPTLPASLSAFEQVLAGNNSATAALGQWCAARGLATPATITATPVKNADIAPPRGLRHWLKLRAGEPIAYRHVRLACGGVVLSQAHNWYVPARLTPGMNATLATTDTPFGKVVAPLAFIRQPLAAREGALAPCPAATILSHRARLVLPSGAGLALVIECYTPANIAH